MTRTLLTLLMSSFLASAALADEPVVGRWTGGSMALSVNEDGRFDWSVGPHSTDGRWTADASLVSMATDRGEVTYAYRVEGDTLTLAEADGTELVMKRASSKRKQRRSR
ncbi:MAG: hypothetical protein R3F61_18610 [Myxococcota bacterium]